MSSTSSFQPRERIKPVGGPGAVQYADGLGNFKGSQNFKYDKTTNQLYLNGDLYTDGVYVSFIDVSSTPTSDQYLEGKLTALGGGGVAFEQISQNLPNLPYRGATLQLTPSVSLIRSSKGSGIQFTGGQSDVSWPVPQTNTNGNGATVNSSSGTPLGDYTFISSNDLTIKSGSGKGSGQKSGNINIIQQEPLNGASVENFTLSATGSLYIQNGERQYQWPTSLPSVNDYLAINTLGNPTVALQWST